MIELIMWVVVVIRHPVHNDLRPNFVPNAAADPPKASDRGPKRHFVAYGFPMLHFSAIHPAINTRMPKTNRNDEVCGRLVSAAAGHSMNMESAINATPTT